MDSWGLFTSDRSLRLTKDTLNLALQCFSILEKIMANPISFSGIDLLFVSLSFSKTNTNEAQGLIKIFIIS